MFSEGLAEFGDIHFVATVFRLSGMLGFLFSFPEILHLLLPLREIDHYFILLLFGRISNRLLMFFRHVMSTPS